jgi:hypothetical protein
MTASRLVVPSTAFAVTSRRTKRPRANTADHLEFIRSLPCVVTGRTDHVEAAHVSFEDVKIGKLGRGKGHKEDDCWALPLVQTEHAIQHESDERMYWAVRGIDPCVTALALWRCSCFGDRETAEIILQHARNR